MTLGTNVGAQSDSGRFAHVFKSESPRACTWKEEYDCLVVGDCMKGANIWGFPKMVVPNNHGFSYKKW